MIATVLLLVVVIFLLKNSNGAIALFPIVSCWLHGRQLLHRQVDLRPTPAQEGEGSEGEPK